MRLISARHVSNRPDIALGLQTRLVLAALILLVFSAISIPHLAAQDTFDRELDTLDPDSLYSDEDRLDVEPLPYTPRKIPPPPKILTVLSLDVAEKLRGGWNEEQKKKPKSTWRHTFGAQRRTRRDSLPIDLRKFDADVVLLQGIRSIREARAMLPARDWKLIVSRQILQITDTSLDVRTKLPNDLTTTAIAVRYRTHVRVTGQQHLFTSPVFTDAQAHTTSSDIKETDTDSARASATLAVRLRVGTHNYWLVSQDFAHHCPRSTATRCAARDKLAAWQRNAMTSGIPISAIIFGGIQSAAASHNPEQRKENPKAPPKRQASKNEKAKQTNSPSQDDGCAVQQIATTPKLQTRHKHVKTDMACAALLTVELTGN